MNTRRTIWRFYYFRHFGFRPIHPDYLSTDTITRLAYVILRLKLPSFLNKSIHNGPYCFSTISTRLGFWRPSWICHIFHEGFIGTLESCDKLSLVSLEGVLSLLWNIYDRDT